MSEALVNDIANLLELCLKKDKEIERLKKELEIEKDISDGMLETIDKAIYMIEELMENNLEVHKGEPIIKILKGEDNYESSDINRASY